MSSDEFKEKVNIEFHKDNMYIWKVQFDIMLYEISKQLKDDFDALKRRTGNAKNV